MTSNRRTVCGGLLGVLLWASTAAAQTSEAGTAPDWGSLKQATLAYLAEHTARPEDARVAETERVNVYFSSDLPALAAGARLSVQIDGAAAADVDLDEGALSVLVEPGLQRRIARFALLAGEHHLSAQLRTATAPAFALADTTFTKTDGVLDLQLRLQADGLVQGRRLDLQLTQPQLVGSSDGWWQRAMAALLPAAGSERYRLGSDRDPAVQHARYLARIGLQNEAVEAWISIAAGLAQAGTPAPRVEAVEAYRAAGLPQQALELCQQLDRHEVSSTTLARLHFHLAESFYEQQAWAQAEAEFIRADNGLPDREKADLHLAYALLLFKQNRIEEAHQQLDRREADEVEAQRYMSDPIEALRVAAFRRYNLGVALAQSGSPDQGLSLIDVVARMPTRGDEQLLALRDQANLSLGWHFLQAQQGRTAIGLLQRVREQGPFSATALVGMGWAQLAPGGERLARRIDEPNAAAFADVSLPGPLKRSLTQLHVLEAEQRGEHGPLSFASDDPPTDRDAGLAQALRIWSLVENADRFDPALQEAQLARAYALHQLKHTAQARLAYAEAIASLEAERQMLGTLAARLQSAPDEVLPGHAPDSALVVLKRLDPPFAFGPYSSLTQHYDEIGRLLEAVNAAPEPQDASRTELVSRLSADRRRALDEIRLHTEAAVSRREQMLSTYLAAAYLSAARVEDPGMASN